MKTFFKGMPHAHRVIFAAIVGLFLGFIVPKVWTASSDYLSYKYGGTDIFRLTTAGTILPGTDNTSDIGSAAYSYNDIFADGTSTLATLSSTSGTITTLSGTTATYPSVAGVSTLAFAVFGTTSTAAPSAKGIIKVDSNGIVYISTTTSAGPEPWVKIGAQ